MGEDNIRSLHKWKNYQTLLENHAIYVYPRLEAKGQTSETIATDAEATLFKNHPKIHLIDAPVVEISSTFIRENIKKGKNVQPLLSSKVWKYVDHNNFYKK
jgi:nicotinate-nucleotide adenylyltransferase